MANFCKYCGSPLKEGARFCAVCGNQTAEIQSEPPEKAQTAMPNIGEKAVQATKTAAKAAASRAVGSFAGQLAPSGCGEAVLGAFGNPAGAAASLIPGVGTVLAGSIKRFFASVKSAFKNPKKLIVPLILAVVWLVLDVLQALNIDILPTRVLSFLTFAKGGLYGGVSGIIGGIVGKGIFAGALMTLISSLTRKNKGQKRSLGDTFSGIFGVSLDSLWGYLTGIGAALLLYLFVSGGMLQSGFTAGIAAAYLCAKASLNRGFLQNLIGSFTAKGKAALNPGAAGVIKGLTVGFAGATMIGQLKIRLILIIPGTILLIGGIVMMILQKTGVIKSKKEAKAS